MSEVSGAVVAASLVLCAVFVPSAFVAGISGQFFRQFAVTIAVSTIISLFVSLTLSPALAAVLMRGHEHGEPPDAFTRLWNRLLGGFFRQFNRAFAAATTRYVSAVGGLLRRSGLALAAYAALLAATILLFRSVPTGFIPAQDQGYLITVIQLPDGASLERTDAVRAPGLRRSRSTSRASPTRSSSWASRARRARTPRTRPRSSSASRRSRSATRAGRRAPELIARAQREVRRRAGRLRHGDRPAAGARARHGGRLQALRAGPRRRRARRRSSSATEALVAAGNADPALRGLFTTFRASTPQLYADIDRTRAKTMDVPLGNVFEALQIYLGSIYVNDFNYLGRTFQVRAQADTAFRADERSVARFKTRNRAGEMVSLGAVVDLKRIIGPDRVVRYNLYPAAEINGDSRPGVSSGAGARRR